jgi:hypothetical protein
MSYPLDEKPAVDWTDQQIRDWAVMNGPKLPKVYVPLRYAMTKDVPNVALVHFDIPRIPVERIAQKETDR